MDQLLTLSPDQKAVYEVIKKECKKNVYCFLYIKTIAKKAKIKSEKAIEIINILKDKKLIEAYCEHTIFYKFITTETLKNCANVENKIFKYKKYKDENYLEKILDQNNLNAMSTWIYLKIITIIKKRMVVSIKELVEELKKAQCGRHSWINALYVNRLMKHYEDLELCQWQKS